MVMTMPVETVMVTIEAVMVTIEAESANRGRESANRGSESASAEKAGESVKAVKALWIFTNSTIALFVQRWNS